MEGFVGAKTISWRFVLEFELNKGSACEIAHTDIKNQSFGGRFRSVDLERAHASDDWADEVDIEYGDQIDDMEDDGQAEEGHAPEWRHDVGKRVWWPWCSIRLSSR